MPRQVPRARQHHPPAASTAEAFRELRRAVGQIPYDDAEVRRAVAVLSDAEEAERLADLRTRFPQFDRWPPECQREARFGRSALADQALENAQWNLSGGSGINPESRPSPLDVALARVIEAARRLNARLAVSPPGLNERELVRVMRQAALSLEATAGIALPTEHPDPSPPRRLAGERSVAELLRDEIASALGDLRFIEAEFGRGVYGERMVVRGLLLETAVPGAANLLRLGDSWDDVAAADKKWTTIVRRARKNLSGSDVQVATAILRRILRSQGMRGDPFSTERRRRARWRGTRRLAVPRK